ncbi:MAG: uncharacterized protein JWL59_2108 [Chthoniobacteraceae bacterium]|nr:uncharacterized protein [Chthoniobacteraceae bacterium]
MKALLSLFLSFQLAHLALAAVSPDQLVEACRAGDLEKTRRLLGKNGNADVVGKDGLSPLLSAMFAHKSDLVAFLLQHGADPNRITRCPEASCSGHPALIFAVHLDEPKMVRLLLDAKADVAWNDQMALRRANVDLKVEIYKMLRAVAKRPATISPVAGTARPLLPGVSELLPAAPAASRSVGEKLRMAIIADESMQSMADLLASDLTAGNFELVERTELNRVIEEQKLTGQSAVEAARAPRLGALLGAEALVLLRKVELGSQSALELRVVRVSPGLVLDTHYRSWPLEDANGWAHDAVQRLDSLVTKVRGQRGIALSPADFRPATNTPAAVSLARETALLVADRFLHQPDVILLERAAIAELAVEQVIGQPGQFWAGSYLVDGTAEAALDDTGTATLTLRLQPIDQRPPQTFTVRGPRSGLGTLVEGLVAQAAKALALAPGTPADLKKEADLHFAESHEAYARSLFLTAWREAETASLLGLRSPEFSEWRLKTDLGVILWQGSKFAEKTSSDPVRWAGWDESWINARMGGDDWLRPPEWLEIGRQCVERWGEVLENTMESGDPKQVAAALAYEHNVIGSSILTWYTLNTSSGRIEHDEQLNAVLRVLRETLEKALAAADRRPELAEAQSALAITLARYAAILYPDPAGYEAVMRALLKRHFIFDDIATRVALRKMVITGVESATPTISERGATFNRDLVWMPIRTSHGRAVLNAFLAELGAGTTPEDALAYEALRFNMASDSRERLAISERYFALLWEKRQLFVDEPRAVSLVSFDRFVPSSKNLGDAPKFANLNPAGGTVVLTPEMLKLRRDLYLHIARTSQSEHSAGELRDPDYHPADEDAAELAALEKKLNEKSNARYFQTHPRTDTPAPIKRVMPKTPTYAAHPPLPVTRTWTVEATVPAMDWPFAMDALSLLMADEKIYFYGEFKPWREVPRGYLFEVSFPSLKTIAWPLPEQAASKQPPPGGLLRQEVYLLVEPDRIYVGKRREFFAFVDRQTGKWEINRDLQPTGAIVRIGADLFFLTESLGARGLVRYSPESRKVELLASNRRTPIQAPLDDPGIEAVDIAPSVDGRLEVILRAAGTPDTETGAPAPGTSKVCYDPANRLWDKAEPIAPPAAQARVMTALTKPGRAQAYKKVSNLNVWTLQLPRENMPKVRIPFEFTALKKEPFDQSDPRDSDRQWFWNKQGYVIFNPIYSSANGMFWFLPQKELDAYLDSHLPAEDETSSVSPATPR